MTKGVLYAPSVYKEMSFLGRIPCTLFLDIPGNSAIHLRGVRETTSYNAYICTQKQCT